MFMYYYTVCYFICIFYAVVRQISMLFIDNKDSVFCILYSVYLFVSVFYDNCKQNIPVSDLITNKETHADS